MTTYAFTSITLNYLPKARVLAQSIARHEPEVKFVLLVAEPVPANLARQFPEFHEIVEVSALQIPEERSWIFSHSVVEICTAIKGRMLSLLLKRPDCEAVLYYDPDTVLFSPQSELFDAFSRASILLTPHLLDPESDHRAIEDNELSALKHGVYNLGFLGVKNTPAGRAFATWWQERLDHYCYADIGRGIFTDQRWVDLAPAYFPALEIIRHRGYNVATWNIAHRPLTKSPDGAFLAAGVPLRFYHFSGFDSGAQLAMLQRYGSTDAAFELRGWYEKECERLDVASFAALPWTYGRYSDGTTINAEERLLYRSRPDVRRFFPDPFTSTLTLSFQAWYAAERRQVRFSGGEYLSSPLGKLLAMKRERTVSPHPLFDAHFYLQSNPDVSSSNLDPFEHFCRVGERELRSPHPLFDTTWYLSQKHTHPPKLPLRHYLAHGSLEPFDPHPLFSSSFYHQQLRQRGVTLRPGEPPLLHYLRTGADEGFDPHPRFCSASYRELSGCGGENPLLHLMTHPEQVGAVRPSLLTTRSSREVFPPGTFRVLLITDSPSPVDVGEYVRDLAQEPGCSGVVELSLNTPDATLTLEQILSECSRNNEALLMVTPESIPTCPWLQAARALFPINTPYGAVSPLTLPTIEGSGVDCFHARRLSQLLPRSRPVTLPLLDSSCALFHPAALADIAARQDLLFISARSLITTLSACSGFRGWLSAMLASEVVGHAPSSPGERTQLYPWLKDHSPSSALFLDLIERGRLASSLLRRAVAPLLKEDSRTKLLAISHNRGGGTEKHVRELALSTEERAITFSATPDRSDPQRVTVISLHPRYPLSLSLSWEELEEVVRQLSIDLIHIHHALGMEKTLPRLVSNLAVPHLITLHDYFFLAPDPHLSDGSSFCGESDEELAGTLYGDNPFTSPPPSLEQWRQNFRGLFAEARAVLAPSQDIAIRYERVFPVACVVTPHPEPNREPTADVQVPTIRNEEPLRVLVLGALAQIKGADVVEACARIAAERRLPLDFVLLGYGYRPLATQPATRLTVLGAYDATEIHHKIAATNPHLAWFPAQCPESYCFTLSEALAAGLPVMVSDLGALPERVAGRSYSWIVPWKSSAEAWVAALLSAREAMLSRSSVRAPGRAPHYDRAFYDQYPGCLLAKPHQQQAQVG